MGNRFVVAMMKRLFLAVAFILAALPASAAFNIFCCTNLSVLGWHQLHIGAGGNVTRVVIACDLGYLQCSPGVGTVTMLARVDVGGGAWYYNNSTTNCGNANRTGCWQQFMTKTAFPSYVAYNAGTSLRELAIAPSNTSHWYVYMGSDGCIYSTTNKGVGFTATNYACTGYTQSNNNAGGLGYIEVDPNNENVAYASAPNNSGQSGESFVTTDGTNWSQVTALGAATSGTEDSTNFSFDVSNGTSGGKTKDVFACVNGTGIYESVNAGSSWTLLNSSSMPTTCLQIVADPTGVVWVNADAVHLYRWIPSSLGSTSGTWSLQVTSGGNTGAYIAIDTNNCSTSATCRIVISTYDGYLNITTNGGAAWTGFNSNYSATATDIPWLPVGTGTPNVNVYLDIDSVTFDPTNSNLLYEGSGLGVWTTNPQNNGTSAYVVTSVSAAIEELVANWAISPPAANPIFGFWDKAVFVSQNKTTYPSQFGPVNCCVPSTRGWGLDYPNDYSSTGMIVAMVDAESAYTTSIGNGAAANWTAFSSLPNELINVSNQVLFSGGEIAASTSTNFMMRLANNGDLFYTTNAGVTWTQTVPSGIPSSGVATTNGTTSTSQSVLHFPTSGSAGGIFSALVTSINAGNIPGIYDYTDSCGPGTVASATSTTVTLTGNSSCNVTSGAVFQFKYTASNGPGWGGSYYNDDHIVCADRTNNGIFYAYNGSTQAPGVYKFTSGGASPVLGYSGSLSPSGVVGGHLGCVPSTAGNTYYSPGIINGSNIPPGEATPFYECTDSSPSGSSATTVSCHAVTTANGYGANVTNVWAHGTGKPKSGGSGYSAVYFYGSIDGATMGVYQTYDHFQTFTHIGGNFFQGVGSDTFPGRIGDSPNFIVGDNNTQGLVYMCFSGQACLYGQFNYLLNRDLDPASNDNSPAFLRKVA